MNTKLLAAVGGTILFAFAGNDATAALAINPAITFTASDAMWDYRPYTLGYSFTLSAPVKIDALGVWKFAFTGSDALAGIWDASGNLIESVTVSATGPLKDGYIWKAFRPIILPAGDYTIGDQSYIQNTYSFPTDVSGVKTAEAFSWVTDEQDAGSGLNYPTVTTGGSYGSYGVLSVDFSVIPEPATWAMLLLGFAGLGFAGHRASQRAAACAA